MISNQWSDQGYTGMQSAFEELVARGELEAFTCLTPRARMQAGVQGALREDLLDAAGRASPDVVLVVSPNFYPHDQEFVDRLKSATGSPALIYFEGDPWDGRAKPVNEAMRAWLTAADIVFSVARSPQTELLRANGARDVRYIPQTYDQVLFEASGNRPERDEVVMIGGRYARFGRVSRMAGAVDRARLVRKLQRCDELDLAIYGVGWRGRGARGVLPFNDQTTAIEAGLFSVNWDHFPEHVSYSSNRLPISLAAGRPHVTTAHPGLEWLPGPESGLFCEPSVAAVVERSRELASTDRDDVLALGAAARDWVRGRLSWREGAFFMLTPVMPQLRNELPEHPWHLLAAEWPDGGS